MQLDVVITFKNLRIRPSFRQNNTLKSRLASDQILWIEQSNRVIIRLLIHQEWYIKIVSDLVCHYQAFDIWYIVLLYPASKEIFPEHFFQFIFLIIVTGHLNNKMTCKNISGIQIHHCYNKLLWILRKYEDYRYTNVGVW